MFTGITIAGYDFELIRYGKYMTEDGRLDYIPNVSTTGNSYIYQSTITGINMQENRYLQFGIH